jgi:apolipoprotein D and lipocalin family protein
MRHNKIKIRFVHNVSGAPPVGVKLNRDIVAYTLFYQDVTSYMTLYEGKYKVKLLNANDNSVLLTKMVRFRYSGTVVVTGDVNDLSTLNLNYFDDDLRCMKHGYANLKFAHTVFGAPNVDVYFQDERVLKSVKFGESFSQTVKLSNHKPSFQGFRVHVNLANTSNTVVGPAYVHLATGRTTSIFASGNLKDGLSAVIAMDENEDCEPLQDCFDVEKYMGKWYQISWIPQPFENRCTRATAEYTLTNTGVTVFNTCYDQNWNVIRTAKGKAVVLDQNRPASLQVSFEGVPGSFKPREGVPNYHVVETDYEYAIVGSADCSNLYILYRKPTMEQSKYTRLMKIVDRLGYDTSRIKVDEGALSKY